MLSILAIIGVVVMYTVVGLILAVMVCLPVLALWFITWIIMTIIDAFNDK